jgi:hypothetical protein
MQIGDFKRDHASACRAEADPLAEMVGGRPVIKTSDEFPGVDLLLQASAAFAASAHALRFMKVQF